MALDQETIGTIIAFVQEEPRTVQAVAKHIGRSWVTTESYIQKVSEQTGLVRLKTFREGTQGALKIVYYATEASARPDVVKDQLLADIKLGKQKKDFDFFEVFQYAHDDKKHLFFETYSDESESTHQHLVDLFTQAQKSIYIFSGNLSFIHLSENQVSMLSLFEEALKRGVLIKIVARITATTLYNISLLEPFFSKYPGQLEVKHTYQPLRGFIIDEQIARFKSEEYLENYKPNELNSNTRIFYDIYDQNWITWLQQVFWILARRGVDLSYRLEQLNKYFAVE